MADLKLVSLNFTGKFLFFLHKLYNSATHIYFIYSLLRFDDLKSGRLVGEDKYGNKYFEDGYYFYGRNRWVEYADHFNMDYDGSQISPEWYGWMHYKVRDSMSYLIIDLFDFKNINYK